ncbi:MAG TPA: hypothetical protein VJS20_00430 [Gemmatimonadales bacterium]|nr:hypothetical protein [Gemmatimonadales bacterium]
MVLLSSAEFHGWWITGKSRPTVRGLLVGAPDSEVRKRYGSPTSTSGDSLLVYCGRRIDTRPPCMYVWISRHRVDRIYVGNNVD